MSERPDMQKITDDQVGAILLAPDEPRAELAERLGVSKRIIDHYRHRRCTRAIRIARELGVIPEKASFTAWPSTDSGAGVLA